MRPKQGPALAGERPKAATRVASMSPRSRPALARDNQLIATAEHSVIGMFSFTTRIHSLLRVLRSSSKLSATRREYLPGKGSA